MQQHGAVTGVSELTGRTVDRVSVDYQFRLVLPPVPPGRSADVVEVVIETPFSYRDRLRRNHVLDPQEDRPTLGIALGLFGTTVGEASVTADGTLAIAFEDGSSVTVRPHPRYEAWHLAWPDGRLLVCPPGGGEPSAWQPPA
jgi:hypothetical protein